MHHRRVHTGILTSTAVDYSQRPFCFLSKSPSSRDLLHGWHRVAFMLPDVYDSDDALNRSPSLRPSVIRYGPDDSIPPFLQDKQQRTLPDGKRDSSSSPTSSEGRSPKHRRRRRRPQATLGDTVLLNILDPNRPDIARRAGEVPLMVDSESEDERRARMTLTSPKQNVTLAKTALNLISSDHTRANTSLPSFKELVSQESVYTPQQAPPPQPPTLRRPRQDSLATSSVGKYTIAPPNHQEMLPALQAPTPAGIGSPENTQSLPSIHSAVLANLESVPSTPFAMTTPTPQLSRGPSTQNELSTSQLSTGPDPSFAPVQMPTPYSHLSPMSLKEMPTTSPPSQSQYSMQPPILTPDTSNMTSYSEASLRGAPIGKSPANNYPTPTELRSALEERPDSLLNGPNIYKCPYPGCTAGAFQTQYLLKYANLTVSSFHFRGILSVDIKS